MACAVVGLCLLLPKTAPVSALWGSLTHSQISWWELKWAHKEALVVPLQSHDHLCTPKCRVHVVLVLSPLGPAEWERPPDWSPQLRKYGQMWASYLLSFFRRKLGYSSGHFCGPRAIGVSSECPRISAPSYFMVFTPLLYSLNFSCFFFLSSVGKSTGIS